VGQKWDEDVDVENGILLKMELRGKVYKSGLNAEMDGLAH
jgi:hypothetical protein